VSLYAARVHRNSWTWLAKLWGRKPTEEKYYSVDRAAYPRRRFIGTENPSMAIAAPHEMTRQAVSTVGGRMVEQLGSSGKLTDYVCGDHMWTGIDYLGVSAQPGPLESWTPAASKRTVTISFRASGRISQWSMCPLTGAGRARKESHTGTLLHELRHVELFLNGKSFGVKGYWFPRVVGNSPREGGAEPQHHVGSAPGMDGAL